MGCGDRSWQTSGTHGGDLEVAITGPLGISIQRAVLCSAIGGSEQVARQGGSIGAADSPLSALAPREQPFAERKATFGRARRQGAPTPKRATRVHLALSSLAHRVGLAAARERQGPHWSTEPAGFLVSLVAYNQGRTTRCVPGSLIATVRRRNGYSRTIARAVFRYDQRLSTYGSAPDGHRAGFVLAGRRRAADATELAEACQATPRGIRILADYLTIIGFLHKRGDRYELTDDAQVFLDRKSPAFLGGAVSFMLAPEMKESFHRLTAAVRRGGTAISDEGTVSHDNPVWVEFARAMAPLMQMPARLLADLVGGDSGQPLRVLDVAAGHGLFGITIAERFRQAHVTALDWPNVLAVAEENARRAGVGRAACLASGQCLRRRLGRPVRPRAPDQLPASFRHPDLRAVGGQSVRGSRAGRPGPHAGFHSRARSHHAAVDGRLRAGDARHHGPRRRVHVCGTAGDLCPGRVPRSEFHALPPTTEQAVMSYKA